MSLRDKLAAPHWNGAVEFTIDHRSADQVTATMPIQNGMLNPFGTVHAGAMIWFADIVATICAVGDVDTVEDSGRGFPLAVDLHTVLVGNEREGKLKAIAQPVKRGRKLTVIRTEVRGRSNRLLIEMTTTHMSAD